MLRKTNGGGEGSGPGAAARAGGHAAKLSPSEIGEIQSSIGRGSILVNVAAYEPEALEALLKAVRSSAVVGHENPSGDRRAYCETERKRS